MKQQILNRRYRVLVILGLVLMIAFVLLLTERQLSSTAEAGTEESPVVSTYISTINAARGEICDRFGNPLVTNSQSYQVIFNRSTYKTKGQNEMLLELLALLSEAGCTYTDSLPISDMPYSFTLEEEERSELNTWLAENDLADLTEPEKIIAAMEDLYGISSELTPVERRRLCGIRYDMDVADFSVSLPFVLVEEADMDLITLLEETGDEFPGLEIRISSTRSYATTYAAHLLGRTGKIYKEEYEELASSGYGMSDTLGKDGVEKSFESILRGTSGYIKAGLDSYGNTVEILSEKEAVAGNNVILTIDLNVQEAAEDALEDLRNDLLAKGEEDPENYPTDVGGGAAVMMNVNTGEVLALASYPTYSLATFSEDYASLLEDELTPMLNRAISGAYPIGSVFKMVTSAAALEEGVITPDTIITDKGRYRKYKGYQPQCWIYRQKHETHGDETVSDALRDSCNYFYYTVADALGIEPIDQWAAAFGLGEKTGIELQGEVAGQRANPESKEKSNPGVSWSPGDNLNAGIGQSYSLFTPIQVCAYISALCNGGNYYQPHLLKEVTTHDYSSVVSVEQPVLVRTIEMKNSTYRAIMEGMLGAAENGTAAKAFRNYPIKVGGKTGSAQVSNGSANAVYAVFAPYDDPEVAVVVYVEHGASGSNVGVVARAMMDAYFGISSLDTPRRGVLNLE